MLARARVWSSFARAPREIAEWKGPARGAALLALSLSGGCAAVPPDPYLGTVDPSPWDALYLGNKAGDSAGCLPPRSGYRGQAGASPAGSKVSWYYLGNFSISQLDITNAGDPSKTPPPVAYKVPGCIPDTSGFDPQFDNYQTDVQYPIFSSSAAEPLDHTKYKPWFNVTTLGLNGVSLSCNQLRSEQTIQSHAGYDFSLNIYTGDPNANPLQVTLPAGTAIRAGTVPFKDWTFYSLGVPIMRSESAVQSCPLYNMRKPGDRLPIYPMTPDDPKSDFIFASLGWWRGLLNGYLDAGDVPLNTTPKDCLGLFETGQGCKTNTDCTAASSVCLADTGRCIATLARIDTGVSCRSQTTGMADPTLCGAGQTCSVSLRCVQTASLTSTGKDCSTAACDASAGEVCVTSGAKKTCNVAPWPVCPKVNDVYVPAAEAQGLAAGSVPVTVNGMTQTADPLVIFSGVRGDASYSPVCRVRRYDAATLQTKIMMGQASCSGTEMGTGRPVCTTQELLNSGTVLQENELSYAHCVFLGAAP